MTVPSHGAEDTVMPFDGLSALHNPKTTEREGFAGAVAKIEATAAPPATTPVPHLATSALPTGRNKLLSMYDHASKADQFALLEVTKSYMKKTEFTNMADSYIRRHPCEPFRFMDLPTEIRVMIARYALTSPKELDFKWKNRPEAPRWATFEGLHKMTALVRTCKQNHTELSNIVWETNVFSFNPNTNGWQHLGTDKRIVDGLLTIGLIKDAVTFLVSKHVHLKLKQITALIDLSRELPGCPLTRASFSIRSRTSAQVRDMTAVVDMIPKAQWVVHDYCWRTYPNGNREVSKAIIESLAEDGKMLAACLASDVIAGIPRNWRLYPRILAPWSEKKVKEGLIAAGVEDAGKWVDEGL